MDDLKNSLREKLQATGVLPAVRAQLQAAVLGCFEDIQPTRNQHQEVDSETADLTSELVREFLEFECLPVATEAFVAESGITHAAPRRAALARDCGLAPESLHPELPLLYHIVALCQQIGGTRAIVVPGEPTSAILEAASSRYSTSTSASVTASATASSGTSGLSATSTGPAATDQSSDGEDLEKDINLPVPRIAQPPAVHQRQESTESSSGRASAVASGLDNYDMLESLDLLETGPELRR
jgi:hypothetical protein